MNIEELREYCLSMPAVSEDMKWGEHLVFSVREKMFCIIGVGEVPYTLSFKASDELFLNLPAHEDNFMPAPYLARAKWLSIKDVSKVGDKLLKDYLMNAYQLIKAKLPKKVQEEIGA